MMQKVIFLQFFVETFFTEIIERLAIKIQWFIARNIRKPLKIVLRGRNQDRERNPRKDRQQSKKNPKLKNS